MKREPGDTAIGARCDSFGHFAGGTDAPDFIRASCLKEVGLGVVSRVGTELERRLLDKLRREPVTRCGDELVQDILVVAILHFEREFTVS